MMKRLPFVIAVLVILLAVPATAQQSQPDQERLLKRGAKKIVIGVVLIGVGAMATPLTGVNENSAAPRSVGAALMVTGSSLALWGVHDRYKAVRPQLTFGATLGQSKAVYFRKRW
jgi:glycerol uptake facilitator-like aquaporin